MLRSELHDRVDEQLDEMGYKDKIALPWGSLSIQVNFEGSREVITISERKTVKEHKPK